MMWDAQSKSVFQHWQAGDEAATRAGLEAMLTEEVAQLLPASSYTRRNSEFFRGSHDWEGSVGLSMQYLGDRPSVIQGVRALLQNNLYSLCHRFLKSKKGETGEETQEQQPEFSPRQWIRRAIVAADFMVWFNSEDGQRELQSAAQMKKRQFLNVDLEADDAAQLGYLRVAQSLAYSREIVYRAMESVYLDAARRQKRDFEVSVEEDEEQDCEGRGCGIEQYSDGLDYTQERVFTLLRKRQLFGLLEEVRQTIPGMEIILFRSPPKKLILCNGYKQWLVFGGVKQRKLKVDHQQLFAMWTSLLPSARFDAKLTVREIAEQNNYSEATAKRLFSDLQTALSQHPRYPELLELMLPIRYRGPVPADVRGFFNQLIREERCKFQQLMGQWRDELNDAERLFV